MIPSTTKVLRETTVMTVIITWFLSPRNFKGNYSHDSYHHVIPITKKF